MRIFLMLLALATVSAVQAKTYRWVDENGRVHYGDRIPAKYAQQRTQTLNDRGIVIEEREAPKTPEELAAEEAQRQAKAKAEAKAAEQKRYDRWLLGTYSSKGQLLERRDDQLAILDSRIASGEKSVQQNQTSLDGLEKRAEKFADQGKPVPKPITRQITEFQIMVRTSNVALDAMRAERKKVRAEFERDLKRWIELKE